MNDSYKPAAPVFSWMFSIFPPISVLEFSHALSHLIQFPCVVTVQKGRKRMEFVSNNFLLNMLEVKAEYACVDDEQVKRQKEGNNGSSVMVAPAHCTVL